MLILFLDLIERLLKEDYDMGPARVLTFITVRAALALALAFAISLLIGPWVIRRLAALKAGQVIRHSRGDNAVDLAAMHGAKAGTPTMGGLLMLFSLLLPALLLCRLNNIHFILLLTMTFGYGALGFWDDYLKIVRKHHGGVSPWRKIAVQGALAVVLAFTLYAGDWGVYYHPADASGYPFLMLPFFKYLYLPLGLFFIPFVVLVLLATSNAVNLTDGLDGLAIGISIANIAAFLIVAYLMSRADFSRYLYVPYIPGGGEMVVFLAALLGSSLGFLWFNAPKAEVFMGDTGSMMLGGAIGTTAVLLKQEMLLLVIGGMFVIEELSVVLQVCCFKLTGTRIFRMSPLHHHYEKLGMPESKIIIRFWLVSWILSMAGLAMLKLR
ncbi:MAG: Phospho-N-acetylmuramoyl-pentapeptide-transferase [candidate division BRC1 bacterium ADurb.BinA292]|nr:MAG: Phospho-N-acetylmuramoyl-pentapeptide-transferase [candidate division BRC1 bacterium ADurb.BinA292]